MLTNHKKQTLNLRNDDPIFISTPGGIIELQKTSKDSRKLDIILPKNFEAVIGKEKLKDTKFFEMTKNGIRPKFKMLVPCFAGDQFIGVEQPGKFTLVEEGENPDVENDSGHETLANVAEECSSN